MKKIVCELCGSTIFTKEEGFFVCQDCGTKYSLDEARKMMQDDEQDISTVRVDATEKISNLYELARRAKKEDNDANAAKYYQMILIEEPNSWEANFFTVYFQEKQAKIAEIGKAASNMKNCLEEVIRMIHDYEEADKQMSAIKEVGNRSVEMSNLLVNGALNHQNNIGDMIKSQHWNECKFRVEKSFEICFEFGDAVEKQYSDNKEIMKYASSIWEQTLDNIYEMRKKNDSLFNDESYLNTYYNKIEHYNPEYIEKIKEREIIENKEDEIRGLELYLITIKTSIKAAESKLNSTKINLIPAIIFLAFAALTFISALRLISVERVNGSVMVIIFGAAIILAVVGGSLLRGNTRKGKEETENKLQKLKEEKQEVESKISKLKQEISQKQK